MEEVAKRYAHAILESNSKHAEQVENELGVVWSRINTIVELAQMLYHPEINIEAKKKILRELTKTFLEGTRSSLDLLLDHKRLDLLGQILGYYRQLRLEINGEIEVEVETALKLEAQIAERIEQMVLKATGLRPIIKAVVNPDILGGIRLSYGDVLVDGSVRKSLNECTAVIKGK